VGAVFAPAVSGTVGDQGFEKPEGATLRVGVLAIEYDADDVV
jgi:hypothetical protein